MSAVSPFSLPLVRPLETARGAIDRREGFLVRIDGDPPGLGEATPLPGWTEPLADCGDALDSALSGGGAFDSVAAEDLDPATLADLDGLPEARASPAARHAVELALLDRAARIAHRPLYRQLGGARRVTTVPVNAIVGDGDVDATVAASRAAVERGVGALKVKVGARPVEADVERVAAVREAVGARVELRVDANGAWSPEAAAAAIGALAELDVALVEQPLPPDALEATAALRGRGVDVALDESLGRYPLDAILDADAADVVVLKPMVLGGVGRCERLADRARAESLDVVVTTTVDGAVARAGAVHLAAALDLDRAGGLATADWLASDVADDPAPVVDGGASVPQSGGHGVRAADLWIGRRA